MKNFSIELINYEYHYLIQVKSRITVILGDSSTGKTNLIRKLDKEYKSFSIASKYELYTVHYRNTALMGHVHDVCLLVDLDEELSEDVIDFINKTDVVKDNIYFILFGRRGLKNLPISIDNLYEFKVIKGITKNIQKYSSEMLYLTEDKVKQFVTEDSKSGYKFIKECFSNTESLNGASNYRRLLKDDSLVFIDALGFGGYISEFLSYVKHERKNVQYILWRSFEYFLYHNVFNGSDEEIDSINLEHEYVKQLYNITRGHYNKTNGCCGQECYKCQNGCKHTNCIKILLTAYPELKDKTDVVTVNNTLQQIINKMSGE